jgi:hypothetical protein
MFSCVCFQDFISGEYLLGQDRGKVDQALHSRAPDGFQESDGERSEFPGPRRKRLVYRLGRT